MNEAVKRKLAVGAEGLYERMANGHSDYSGVEEDFLDDWESALSEDRYELLDRRLESLQLSRGEVSEYAAATQLDGDEELPAWVDEIEAMLSFIDERDWQFSPSPNDSLPFQQFFKPFVVFATTEFEGNENYREIFSESAWEQLRGWLLSRLVNLGAQTIHLEYCTFCARRDPTVLTDDPETNQLDDSELYEQFLNETLNRLYLNLFTDYPALARSIATIIKQWQIVMQEFLHRFRQDGEAIESRLIEGELGQVAAVEPGVGDLHDHGRSVFVLELESGQRLVYKPRDITIEESLYELLNRVGETAGVEFLTPKTITRADHGWVEYIPNEDLENRSDASCYYERIGILICVLYVLNGSDFHFENLVASGEYPCPIDGETAMSQWMPIDIIDDGHFGRQLMSRAIQDSVLNSMMLPFGTEYVSEDVPDLSGIGAIGDEVGINETLHWRNVNSDYIDFEYKTGMFKPGSNYPVLNGTPVYPETHTEDIVRGFRVGAEAVVAIRDDPDAIDIADHFGDAEARILVRPTQLYQAARNELTNPRSMENGLQRTVVTEKLVRKAVFDFGIGSLNLIEPILRAEREALLRHDVPRFTTLAGTTDLLHDGEVLMPDFFSRPTLAAVRENVATLSPESIEEQTEYIRRALRDEQLFSANEPGVPRYE